MVLGFFLAGFLALRKGKPNGLIIPDVCIIGAMALLGAVIGGGVLYIFVTYSLDEIIAFVQRGDFSFLNGGIVFYGGLIGGVLGALLGIRIAGCSLQLIEHSVIPFVPLGHAVGRIGCVMAGCCHGFEYDGLFALYYPNSVSGLSPDQGYFPVQPLESLINVGICLILLWFEKRMKRATGLLFVYLGLYSISRFFLEMLRGDAVRGVWNGFSTSQIISMVMLCVSIVGLLWKRNPKGNS
jgi:phosphatidylglycerol:prolipoprotein diacylglycerol transferase